jgi:hypothetical protein
VGRELPLGHNENWTLERPALLLNDIPVAVVRPSGGWGYYIQFMDGDVPLHMEEYYQNQTTAFRNAEKRFGVHVKYRKEKGNNAK